MLVVAFTYFYTAITINPTQMAEDMKKNGGFIPGVKPGKKTVEFLDTVMSRITLPGSIFLGFGNHSSGICHDDGNSSVVCLFLWRNIVVNSGWSCVGYSAAN